VLPNVVQSTTIPAGGTPVPKVAKRLGRLSGGTRHCWGHLALRPPFVGLLTRHRQPSGPGPNMSHGIAQLALSGPHRPDDWSHIVAGPEPLQTQLTSHPNGSRLKAVMVVNRLTSPARGSRSGRRKSDGDPQNKIRLPAIRRYLANHWLGRQVAGLCQNCSISHEGVSSTTGLLRICHSFCPGLQKSSIYRLYHRAVQHEATLYTLVQPADLFSSSERGDGYD
jgi:hypothetical protein